MYAAAPWAALEEELAHVGRRLEELPKEERRLVEGYRRGFDADFMMREETERVRQERATSEKRRCELESQLARLDRALSHKGQIEELAKRLSQGLDSMGFTERRELLRLLVDEVVYDNSQVTIRAIIPLEQLHPIPPQIQSSGGRVGKEWPVSEIVPVGG